ncbi:MAG TPA: Wzz/FepE/Etk N-terminal domain-containing protein [Herpetosiphonaceae bacterium]
MQEYDDIDLRPYLTAVARRWYWIVVGALLAALVVAGISTQLPKEYTATASVLMFIRQTGSQVGANEPLVRIETIDITARRQGLLALAESPAIETQIKPEDLQRVAPASYTPGTLTEEIAINATGDLLTVAATAPTPEQAQLLADVWANTFVSYVDTLYTDEHSQVQLAGKALLPIKPSFPRIALFAVFAGLIGGLVATAIVMGQALLGTSPNETRRRSRHAAAPGRSSGPQPVSRVSASQTRGE